MKIDPISIARISAMTGGQCISFSSYDPQKRIDRIFIDSRRSENTRDCLFVALSGHKDDGHRYIGELYRAGVRHFLLHRLPRSCKEMPDAVFIKVEDTLEALQRWAKAHRESFSCPVVAIGGSNGKTCVKEWLAYLCGFDSDVVRSPKSFNSQIGVPLSLLQMQARHGIGIFEAGISQCGEMEKLNRMIRPDVGIFTNIGSAHEVNFASRQEKIREKLKLFKGVGKLIYCIDYKDIEEQVLADPDLRKAGCLTWTSDPSVSADLVLLGQERRENGMELAARYKDREIRLRIPFFDKASVENAVHCWLFLLDKGCTQEDICRRFSHLPVVSMRMEMKEGLYNSFLISDVYNSDFDSFSMALDFLCSHGHSKERCVILSDMLQSARDETGLYQDVARLLKNRGIEEFVGIGPSLLLHKGCFLGFDSRFYPDTDAFLKDFKASDYANKAVLIKGARIFALERISNLLQRKVHETVLEVNLTALVQNLNFFRSLVRPQTKVVVMGKAFSYGSGSHEIADVLEYNHVDYVSVAYPDEAVALRNKGIRIPIMCMNPESGGMETLIRYRVEPVVYDYRILQSLQVYLDHVSRKRDLQVNIHLALDTGMHRMGFEEKDLDSLIGKLQSDSRCRIRSVFTHLATADMPEMDCYTRLQLERFDRMSGKIVGAFPYRILRHCLNTAGIFRFPEYQYDMVRLGIGLYGVGTDPQMQSHLETVSTLKTVISLIRRIPAGDAVGYGRRFIASRDTTVGVIGVGYADGLNRHLGNGRGKVWINGHMVPIIGNICMDMCMVDLTGIEAHEQDEVIVFGRELPITQLAQTLDTIPYEILTGISPRVARVYYQE